MQRIAEERLLVGVLDNASEVHDRDAVADVLDHGEIVRNEQVREVLFLLQIHHEIDDLRLDRDVERGDRFVADDQLRIEREGPRYSDPLPLAPRKLVRQAVHLRRAQAYALEQRGHPLPVVLGVPDLVNVQRLAHDVSRGHARIERRERILENDLGLTPVGAHL
jgi:hypothetical protein